MVLTKTEILEGTSSYEEYELESRDGSVSLRPLTIGEIHQIQQLKDKGLGEYIANQKGAASKKRIKSKIEAQAKMNIEKVNVAENKADVKTVLFGLDNKGNPEKWTEQDVLKMDEPLFKELLEKVKEISHMEDEDVEDDVEDFPEDE